MSDIDADTRRWVREVVGRDVVRAERLRGAMSSRMQRCWLDDGNSVVVRQIDDADWLDREPGLIEREARALRIVAAAATITAPTFLAADPIRGRLLMSWLPGTARHEPDQLRRVVAAIADAAVAIATVPIGSEHGLPAWKPWAPAEPEPPSWGDRGLWTDAIDAFRSKPAPSVEKQVLVHRDLHPLNLLFGGTRVVGVVDWVNACAGHPHAELGHCRWNLAVLCDLRAADAFLRRYAATTTFGPYDAWWDVCAVMGFLPGPVRTDGWFAVGRTDLDAASVVDTTERFLRLALARL